MSSQTRSLIRIAGDDRVSFLHGILTNDITKLAAEKIQFAALLSPQGKILHDMFLIGNGGSILIDTAARYKDMLMKRLMMYRLRARVTIEELTTHDSSLTIHDSLPDPRHPELPPYSPLATRYSPLALGIPELGRDFAPDEIVALDAGYDLLHAVSFTKGCYVGQEVTARMHYKQIARRGFFILERDETPERLALLKFEDVATANHTISLDGILYRARLPDWMQSKWSQWQSNTHNA